MKSTLAKNIIFVLFFTITNYANAQFNILVHNDNDTIVIPTSKVDSVSFDMTPEMQAQMKMYKTVKVLTCEKDDAHTKCDSTLVDSLQNEVSAMKERLNQVLQNYENMQKKLTELDKHSGYVSSERFEVDVECNNINNKTWYVAENINNYVIKKVYKDNAVIYLPTSYTKNGEPTKLVIFCKHGGSQVTSSSDPIFNVNVFNYLLYLGYAVLACDGMPDGLTSELNLDDTRVVGNYFAVTSVRQAYNYVMNKYNLDNHGAYCFGYSQGGHYAQNVIDMSGIPFVCSAQLSPVCSMRYHQWDLKTSGSSGGISNNTLRGRMNIARLFGFPSFSTLTELQALEYNQSLVQGYDPWTRNVENPYNGFIQGTTYGSHLWKLPNGTNIAEITMKKYTKCPLKIWCADDDNALGVDVMKVFIQAIKNAGIVADMHCYTSGGHNIYMTQTPMGTFVDNNNTYNLYPLAYEIAEWFNKFGGYKIK